MKSTKLLTIELDEYDSVPRVMYQGEEIKGKIHISFDWKTDDESGPNLPSIHIKHMDKSLGENVGPIKTISLESFLDNAETP